MTLISRDRLRLLLLSGLVALAPAGAMANDSSATLETGSLVYVFNGKVEMQQEDLFLSRSMVRVHYLFHNKSDQDVETLVAFPLPDIATGEAGNYDIHASDPINFIGFEVTVDGQKITPSIQAKAMSLGVDITDALLKYHLPLTTIFADDDAQSKFYDNLNRLPAATLSELVRVGAVTVTDQGAGLPPNVEPKWTTNITFYWFQKFPAGKTIEVTHKYRPVPYNFLTSSEELGNADTRKSYCPEPAFLRAAKAWDKTGGGGMKGAGLHYIVHTARYWFGSIGRFNLTIDKENPKSLVASCFKGLQSTGPTTFAASRDNYSPDDDLGVLLVDAAKTE